MQRKAAAPRRHPALTAARTGGHKLRPTWGKLVRSLRERAYEGAELARRWRALPRVRSPRRGRQRCFARCREGRSGTGAPRSVILSGGPRSGPESKDLRAGQAPACAQSPCGVCTAGTSLPAVPVLLPIGFWRETLDGAARPWRCASVCFPPSGRGVLPRAATSLRSLPQPPQAFPSDMHQYTVPSAAT